MIQPRKMSDILLLSSSKIQFLHLLGGKMVKEITKPGNLFAVGEENGIIQIFQATKKICLRKFTNNQRSVGALAFSENGVNLLSGADDSVLSLTNKDSQIV